MRREGQVWRALACGLVLVANGAGALAQDQGRAAAERRVVLEKAVQEGHATGSVVINGAPSISITSQGGPMVAIGGGQGGEYGFTFVSSEMAFDSKVIKGVPFSADAVTESVQLLGDGNRITHSSSAKLYRDTEGRTRREQSLGGVGALAASGETPQTVFINDPIAGTNYILNTESRTAQKAMQFFFKREGGEPAGAKAEGNYTFTRKAPEGATAVISGGRINSKAQKPVQPTYPAVARAAGAQGSVDVEVVIDEQGKVESAKAVSGHELLREASVDAARQWVFSPTLLQGKPVKVKGVISFEFALSNYDAGTGKTTRVITQSASGGTAMAGGVMVRKGEPGEPKSLPRFAGVQESLGTQSVEGVMAEGTRTTVTIPAGAMGNERPILIVSERWYSPELQTVVMTKHSDPRFGETTYRLTNISRSEPASSLFEVPAGYTVTEGRSAQERMMMSLPRKQQQ
ncbi:MAG: energy transducer TonB [Pyrinomonadaceae bacterium]